MSMAKQDEVYLPDAWKKFIDAYLVPLGDEIIKNEERAKKSLTKPQSKRLDAALTQADQPRIATPRLKSALSQLRREIDDALRKAHDYPTDRTLQTILQQRVARAGADVTAAIDRFLWTTARARLTVTPNSEHWECIICHDGRQVVQDILTNIDGHYDDPMRRQPSGQAPL